MSLLATPKLKIDLVAFAQALALAQAQTPAWIMAKAKARGACKHGCIIIKNDNSCKRVVVYLT